MPEEPSEPPLSREEQPPTRVQALLAREDFRSLPAHLREPMLIDATAADVAEAKPPEAPKAYGPTNEGGMALQPVSFYPGEEPGLEEGFTKPRNMILMAGMGALGGFGAATTKEMGGGWLAQALGAGTGAEAVNVLDKATQPGATPGSVLTPDLSDALAFGFPVIPAALKGGTRAATQRFAQGTTVGKTALNEAGAVTHLEGESGKLAESLLQRDASIRGQLASNALTPESGTVNQTFHVKALADFDAQVAQRQARESRQALTHTADAHSWDAVMASQVEDARAQAEFARTYNKGLQDVKATDARRVRVTKEGQVDVLPDVLQKLPNVPTKDEVKLAYKDAQGIAESSGIPVRIPEVEEVQKEILTLAVNLEKVPGGEQLAGTLRRIANVQKAPAPTAYDAAMGGAAPAGLKGYNLNDIAEALPLLRAHATSLRNATTAHASTELHAYGQLIDAFEQGLHNLSTTNPDVGLWQNAIKIANAKNTKYKTVDELEQFATHDWIDVSPTGLPQFNARKGLAAIDSSSHERLRFFLKQTTFDELGGKSLYDLTKETLHTLAKEGLTLGQQADLIAMQGGKVAGTVLPRATMPGMYRKQPFAGQDTRPDFSNSLLTQGARIGVGAGAIGAYAAGVSPVAVGLGGSFAAIGPQTIARLMGTPQGQKFLVKLIQEQGTTITPSTLGFMSAAARASLQPVLGSSEEGQPASR